MDKMFEMRTKIVLTEAAQKVLELLNREVRISISRESIEKLEENEVFAAATKEGVSREFCRSLMVPTIDHVLDTLNLERLNNSMTMALVKGSLDEKLDLTSYTGEDIFDTLESAGAFEKVYEPEFKKQIILNEAIELAAQKGNISLNTAIKKVIVDMSSEDYVARQVEKANKLFDKIVDIINPIIEFYLQNETAIILEIMMNKK